MNPVSEPKPNPSEPNPTEPTAKPPIINCHTHTFTSGHVPQFLAKTYLPWPFYYLLPLHFLVFLCRAWIQGPGSWPYKPWYGSIAEVLTRIKETLVRDWVLGALHYILGLLLGIQVFYIVYGWVLHFWPAGRNEHVDTVKEFLQSHHLQYDIHNWYWQVLLTLALCLFFPSARNLLVFVFNTLYGFLKSLPGKNTQKLLQRYLNLCRFAFHQNQLLNFDQLRDQYPLDTRFVVLPMDMKYMAAGNTPIDLAIQMKDLERIKTLRGDQIMPFVFADPRRIAKEPGYFDWTTDDKGDVVLKDCVIKHYIEDLGFCGFKIYPALGYYPFAPELLPLWKYAAKKGLPITTHCIRGPIFYRGIKKPAWDKHPIFTDAEGKELFLPQIKNIDFIVNFTHPLNFLCLLDKSLLAKAVGQADERVQKLFGYKKQTQPAPGLTTDSAPAPAADPSLAAAQNPAPDPTQAPAPPKETIECDLADLKICLGHFGGEDEWTRYFEMDRYRYAACVDKFPDKGIDFFNSQGTGPVKPTPGKIGQVWKYVDWYSIICSLIIQYKNVYADISFILHDPGILPLLYKTLHSPNNHLRERVLYGTDFYVVRNYASDREMLATLYAGLDEDDFDQIARYNPRTFLNLAPCTNSKTTN